MISHHPSNPHAQIEQKKSYYFEVYRLRKFQVLISGFMPHEYLEGFLEDYFFLKSLLHLFWIFEN